MLGAVFGLLTAISFGYDLLAPWLLIAYVLGAVTAIHGALLTGRETSRLLPQLLAADGSSDDSLERRYDRALASDAIVTGVLIGLLVADMVFKPFL